MIITLMCILKLYEIRQAINLRFSPNKVHMYSMVYHTTAELKIMVYHSSFSDPFWYMTDQIQFGRTYFTVHFQWGSH